MLILVRQEGGLACAQHSGMRETRSPLFRHITFVRPVRCIPAAQSAQSIFKNTCQQAASQARGSLRTGGCPVDPTAALHNVTVSGRTSQLHPLGSAFFSGEQEAKAAWGIVCVPADEELTGTRRLLG